MDDFEEDLEEGSDRDARGSKPSGERANGNRVVQILLGILIVVVVAGGVYYFVKVRPSEVEESSIQTKLAAFEQKIASLEKQITDSQAKPAEDTSVLQRLDSILQRVDALEKRTQTRTQAKETPAKTSKPADPQLQYHKVQKGDTLHAISKRYGVPVAELRKINHLSKGQSIHTGQKLLLAPADQSGNHPVKN